MKNPEFPLSNVIISIIVIIRGNAQKCWLHSGGTSTSAFQH